MQEAHLDVTNATHLHIVGIRSRRDMIAQLGSIQGTSLIVRETVHIHLTSVCHGSTHKY
jgi:hypothetical protein